LKKTQKEGHRSNRRLVDRNNIMDAGVAGLIGAGIGGGVTLLAQILLVWHQDRAMRHSKVVAEEAWVREKLHEIYVNCIAYIRTQSYAERDKWLNLLLVYHPERTSDDFSKFVEKKTKGALDIADIIELAQKDQRIQGISYKTKTT
jgi:hypothetical protein